ncbi:putative expressed protein [Lyophyllum shimeji]|uniref:Expressed protein n=1 Tax=Lyophyllum shimeji TaxID=47721 RepID=A0A9P3PN03_LYOSH|nr:putative expressed protein [Lyophyllum shimeji]
MQDFRTYCPGIVADGGLYMRGRPVGLITYKVSRIAEKCLFWISKRDSLMGLFDTSLGAILLGVFFNTFLFGLVSFQYAAYHNTKFDDPRWIRSLVSLLFLLDTFISASIIYLAWIYSVDNFTNPSALLLPVWPYPLTVLINTTTAFLVQLFLTYRIYRLKVNKSVCGIIVFFSLSSFVVGMACGAEILRVPTITDIGEVKRLVTAWLCLEVGVDSLIIGILSHVLARSRTGFHRSETVVNRLIRAAIQTGLLTGLFSVLCLVCFVKFSSTRLYAMFGIPIGRIYTCTLMDTLLVRQDVRGPAGKRAEHSIDMTNAIWTFDDRKIPSHRQPHEDRSIQLHIRTEVHTNGGIGTLQFAGTKTETTTHGKSETIIGDLKAEDSGHFAPV